MVIAGCGAVLSMMMPKKGVQDEEISALGQKLLNCCIMGESLGCCQCAL